MEARYNIYFAGQLLEGHDLATVRARMAELFNANAATLDKLFSGKTQLIKRDCDKATALEYKRAIERAGALPVIRAAASAATPAGADTGSGEPMTAAEKIAALAAAPDPGRHAATAAGVEQAAVPSPGELELAPAGTAVLRPEERPAPVTSQVVPPELDVDALGQQLAPAQPAPPPPPDTSHLSEGAVGELLPNLPSSAIPASPDTSAIDLSPAGTDFSDCTAPSPVSPDLDLSRLALAPAGADVLEQQYRQKRDQRPPPTDHLALED